MHFENLMFEDCGNCIAMEQSGYISEWQNLLLTLTSQYIIFHNTIFLRIFLVMLFNKSKNEVLSLSLI